MNKLRSLYRTLALVLHTFYAIVFLAFFPNDKYKITTRQWTRVRRWHRVFLQIMGIKLEVKGSFPDQQPCFIVCNHISWLDIPVISSLVSTSFVAKGEIANWPLIGWFCKKVGIIFIQRGNHGAAEQTHQAMIKHLEGGLNILLFPEGTTSHEQQTRTFHSRLFRAAIDTKTPIVLISIRYPNSPHADFVGHISFKKHFLSLLKHKRTQAQVDILEIIPPNLDSRTLAKQCQQKVIAHLSKPSKQGLGQTGY